ncbi:MAG: hypothetical protein HY816_15545, partial [Candidatus Wallbacteria bacterium]|nr:hypothetical protein [Candidatus Wallbacteria bacterium]
TAARPSFTPLVSRVYGFELTVSDGRLEATTSIDIVVDSPFNSVPRASLAVAPAALAGSAVTLDGGRSADPDGGALLYRWVQTGGVPVTSTSARVARFSFVPPVAGLYRFRLFVDDGRDRSTPQEVTVNAAAPATPGGSGSTGGTPAAAGGGGGGGCALGEGGGALEPSVLLAALLAWLLALRCRRPA